MSETFETKPIDAVDPTRVGAKPERPARVAAPQEPSVAAILRHFGNAAVAAVQIQSQQLAEAPQNYAQTALAQWQQTAHKLLEVAEANGRDLRALAVLPLASGSPLGRVQEAMGSLVAGMVEGRFDATHDMLRLAEPAHLLEHQQRFVRTWLDTLTQGSAIMVQSARVIWGQAGGSSANPAAANGEERQSRVSDVMRREVRIASPDDTVQQAARLMREDASFVLPVGDADRLVGMVTDRELALCLATDGRDPARTKLREVMTPEVAYVFEDDDLGPVAESMAEQQVRRLPVLSRDKRVVGVVSLADLFGRHRPLMGTPANSGPHIAAA